MISIRSETPEDYAAIRQVIIGAFEKCEFGHNGEADLVDQLRNNCDNLLSLVAVDDDEVVGHILFSPVSINIRGGELRGMGLAPMAVAPNRQKVGIGTALVEEGLRRLANSDCQFALVLGHPQYYPRFGFVPAAQYGISHGFAGIPKDVFFVKFFNDDIEQSVANGLVYFRPEFGPQHDEK